MTTIRKRATARQGPWVRSFDYIRRDRVANLCLAVLILTILAAILGPWFVKCGLPDPYEMDLRNQVAKPSREHWLGTDSFGRDVLSRLIFGARVSVSVGFVAVGLSTFIGLPLGVISGYCGGRIDNFIMRIMDAFLALPPILLALTFVGFMGPGIRNVMLALGIVHAPRLARVVRAKTLSVREQEYIIAGKALGAGTLHLQLQYILPNVISSVLVQTTVAYAYSIISEAGMSFLGLGTQPPTPSWGIMISEARSYIIDAPWYILFPGITISVLVLSITMLGDSLREALDPKQQ